MRPRACLLLVAALLAAGCALPTDAPAADEDAPATRAPVATAFPVELDHDHADPALPTRRRA